MQRCLCPIIIFAHTHARVLAPFTRLQVEARRAGIGGVSTRARFYNIKGRKQTFKFSTSPVKGFTSEVQLTQERNLYQKATVKQFTSEVNS